MILLSLSCDLKSKYTQITVDTQSPPETVDPVDFDYFIHHLTFRSVLATLVSNNGTDEAIPYLAKSWSSHENDSIWRFRISDEYKFEDGTPIDAKAIKISFERLGRILERRGSSNEIFKALSREGGIEALDDELVLRFKSPMPRALYHLGFGLFGVVSSSDFDSQGNWRDKRVLNSSGAYKIISWDDKNLKIQLKPSYPIVGVKNKIQNISFVWGQDQEADLQIGFSDSDLSGYKFVGQVYSGFTYIHCYSWADPSNPLFSKEERKKFRNFLYTHLNDSGIPVAASLFPISRPGFRKLTERQGSPDWLKDKKIKFANAKVKTTRRAKSISDLMKDIGLPDISVHASDFDSLLDPHVFNKKIDCRYAASGVHLDEPIDDLKFMFFSKEGIRLPDPTGKIKENLSAGNIDLGLIEDVLWEDAIVFPLGHHATGIWHKTDLDFSQVSSIHPPIDFIWVGTGD